MFTFLSFFQPESLSRDKPQDFAYSRTCIFPPAYALFLPPGSLSLKGIRGDGVWACIPPPASSERFTVIFDAGKDFITPNPLGSGTSGRVDCGRCLPLPPRRGGGKPSRGCRSGGKRGGCWGDGESGSLSPLLNPPVFSWEGGLRGGY